MDELIRHDNPEFTGLVDLGSCSIHTIHNAFGKGLEKCGKEIEQLCMDLHALFKYRAARREDFREVQIEMDLDLTNFLQHSSKMVEHRTCSEENSGTVGSCDSICN